MAGSYGVLNGIVTTTRLLWKVRHEAGATHQSPA